MNRKVQNGIRDEEETTLLGDYDGFVTRRG